MPVLTTFSPFFCGVNSTLCVVAALIFLRFFRRSGDWLFVFFSISFLLQGIARILVLLVVDEAKAVAGPVDEANAAPVYWLRVVAYGLILIAIIMKNRGGSKARDIPGERTLH